MSVQASSAKKATNLSIRADLLAEAKALNINLSQAFESHLAELVRTKKREHWLEENRKTIAAYNQRIEEQGVFSDGWRIVRVFGGGRDSMRICNRRRNGGRNVA